MLKYFLVFVFLLLVQMASGQRYNAGQLSVLLDDKGAVISLKDEVTKKDYAAVGNTGTLLQVVEKGKTLNPEKASFKKDIITLWYPGGGKAVVKTVNKKSYLRLELVDIHFAAEAVRWGPFNSVIADTIGNMIGVVRDGRFAFGLQGLNAKTSGGELANEEGAVYERGTAATTQPFGSSLQAFTVNRLHDRIIKVWDRWPSVTVKGIADGGLKGSAIALFGCLNGQVLNVLETITTDNGMPHANWKGQWLHKTPESGRPYLITTFNESNVDSFLNCAAKMGMAGVYHEEPFDAWGHFVLRKDLFPNGRTGFKACVDKAHKLGLRLGFHTLTTFITTNDSFVTPKPHPGLALAGSASLVENTTANAEELTVSSAEFFTMRSDVNCIRIGDELIRFMEVSKTPPYKLTGCSRGAFGTARAAHNTGAAVSRLVDHPYKVLFPDWQLQKQVAKNIAAFINETGADQMDFDGHEGTYSNGMGDLSFNTFAEDVFNQSSHPVVFGSSRANHYFWHINNYLNWGEPWYGGFRESQGDLRISNQEFYEKNYLPNMLGWFLVTATTDPDDIDWMLARAAGFNAGYALVLREDGLANKKLPGIINLVRLWTNAQQNNLFNEEQRTWLKDPANEAHLEKKDDGFTMQRFSKFKLEHEAKAIQPGEPLISNLSFDNPVNKQRPRIILLASGESGEIARPVIEIDNSFRLELPITLTAGQSLVIDDGATASIYNSKGQFVKTLPVNAALPELGTGNHTLSFSAGMSVNNPLKAVVTVRLAGREELLKP